MNAIQHRQEDIENQVRLFMSDPVRHGLLKQLEDLYTTAPAKFLIKTNGEIETIRPTSPLIQKVEDDLHQYERNHYPSLFISPYNIKP